MKAFRYITIGLLFSLMACGEKQENEEAESAVEECIIIPKSVFKNNKMKEVGMQEKQIYEVVKCTGTIDAPPQNRASISNFLGGYVVKNPLLVGDRVEKGQMLLSLDNPDFIHLQENYLALKAELEYSKKDFQRQEKLYSDSISSAESYQAAKSNYEVKSARLSALEQKLKLLNVNTTALTASTMKSRVDVFSPIDGVVSKVNTQLGSYVSPQAIMLEIIDGSHLHLELEVYEKDIAKIKKEQEVEFSISDVGDHKMIGDVHLIGNTVDAVRRTVKVHGHVPDSLVSELRVGMFISANIRVGKRTAYGFPSGTVIKHEGQWKGMKIAEETEEEYVCELVVLRKVEENEEEYSSAEPNEIKLIKGAYHYIGKGESDE